MKSDLSGTLVSPRYHCNKVKFTSWHCGKTISDLTSSFCRLLPLMVLTTVDILFFFSELLPFSFIMKVALIFSLVISPAGVVAHLGPSSLRHLCHCDFDILPSRSNHLIFRSWSVPAYTISPEGFANTHYVYKNKTDVRSWWPWPLTPKILLGSLQVQLDVCS